MIEKMTKYSFVLLSENAEEFLAKLQELGVMDISRSSKAIDETSAGILDDINAVKKAAAMLRKADYTEEPQEKIQAAASKVVLGADPVSQTYEVFEKIGALSEKLAALQKEFSYNSHWGEFDSEKIEALKAMGYTMHYYVADKYLSEWEFVNATYVIEKGEDKTYFVAVTSEGEECRIPLKESPAPAGSCSSTLAEIDSVESELALAKATVLALKEQLPKMDADANLMHDNLDIHFAKAASKSAAENLITVVEGFAPTSTEGLEQELDKIGVYYIKEDAVEEDNPPIKLKNNRFIKLFESLTGMYGMPVYSEFDPTPILGPFFLLFFALCMGDAGYGLLLIPFGIAVKKGWLKIEMFDGLGSIITVLGIGTLIVGLFLGTFFGINLAEASWVPEGLKSVMLTGNVGDFSVQMILALGIGVFHLCLAMVVKAVCFTTRFGFKETISTWSWTLLIIGGIIIAALSFGGILGEGLTKILVILLGVVSGLGIYIFNKIGRNPLMNIGAGLWDTYNVVTGLLGDVLSYIRLYALGLAGGMLGNAFNNLGGMILGDSPTWQFLPFLLVVLMGHALNMAMSCLGAFVHPLRLTFVEYFKNSGFEGKGAFYRPLAKKN